MSYSSLSNLVGTKAVIHTCGIRERVVAAPNRMVVAVSEPHGSGGLRTAMLRNVLCMNMTWIPAFAGKTVLNEYDIAWIPAFAGKTEGVLLPTSCEREPKLRNCSLLRRS